MFGFTPLRLDVSSLGMMDERLLKIANVVAEETEVQRELERAKNGGQAKSPGLEITGGLLGGDFSYADSLRWDLLLTFGNCSGRCAERAGIDEIEMLGLVMDYCCPTDPWLLFWYQAALKAISKGVGAEVQAVGIAQALAVVQAKHQRIKEGARVGGMKSALSRRKIQSTPSGPDLIAERDSLVAGGMDARNVAAKLARKYNVTPAAIRAAYKRI